MKGVSNIINRLTEFVAQYKSKLPDVFFWYFIASFFIDRILFSISIAFPFFVVSGLLVFPFLFFVSQYKNPDKGKLYVLIASFLLITTLNSIVYLFDVKNISDLLFVVLFFTIYFYYKYNMDSLKNTNVYVFLVLSLFLFSFTFFGFDADSSPKRNTNYYSTFSEKKVSKKNIAPVKKAPSVKKLNKKKPKVKKKSKQIDKLKPFKLRHTGLFRRTHMASYFFGFLFLFFSYQYQKNRGVHNAIILVLSLAFCFYTGIRTMPVAFIISIFLFLFRKKYIYYLIGLLAVLAFLIVANDHFLQMTRNTIFYQYFYLIHSGTENFTGLARFRLYQSWWMEVREFGFWDFIIGKSYINAMVANGQNYGMRLWFHNDFLNIFYTYGIWAAMLYIWFFIKIYRDNKDYIKQNIFIFVFYCSMVIAAIVNGFYYYFPVFLLYLFLVMIKKEKQVVQ